MGLPTAEKFAQRAFQLGLLTEQQLDSVWGEFRRRDVPLDDFRNALLRREFMTNYQVERLQRGERSGFFHGDHKVLYLVGTGTRSLWAAAVLGIATFLALDLGFDDPAAFDASIIVAAFGLAAPAPAPRPAWPPKSSTRPAPRSSSR